MAKPDRAVARQTIARIRELLAQIARSEPDSEPAREADALARALNQSLREHAELDPALAAESYVLLGHTRARLGDERAAHEGYLTAYSMLRYAPREDAPAQRVLAEAAAALGRPAGPG